MTNIVKPVSIDSYVTVFDKATLDELGIVEFDLTVVTDISEFEAQDISDLVVSKISEFEAQDILEFIIDAAE